MAYQTVSSAPNKLSKKAAMLAVQSTSPVHQQYRNAGSSATTHATGDKPKAPKLRHLRKPSTSPQLTQVCSFLIDPGLVRRVVDKDGYNKDLHKSPIYNEYQTKY